MTEPALVPLARSTAASVALFKAAKVEYPHLTAIKVVERAAVYTHPALTFLGAKHG